MTNRADFGGEADRRFKLAPGIELVLVSEGRYTLRSEFDAVELSGDAAGELAENVLNDLYVPMGLAAIRERLPGYSRQSIVSQLEALIEHGLVVELSDDANVGAGPMEAFLDIMGRDLAETTRALENVTVAVFGLEAHGAHLARMLAQLGIGTIRLVDPFSFEEGHLELTPITDAQSVGRALQDAVAEHLEPFNRRIECPVQSNLDADIVREVVSGCDLAFGCWDQSFGAATHWLNRAALGTGVPVLFGELRTTSTMAGPLYLPSRSACWMCYRMRAVACAPDFEQAIAFEEHLDRARRPRLASRATIPVLAEMLASSMTLEAIRLFTGIHPPVLVDNVAEYDAMTHTTEIHPVLTVPNCPVCSKKKERVQPPLDELIAQAAPPTDLAQAANRLVDARTGVVSQFGAVPRDPTEIPVPLVWRAKLANHRFLSEHDDERATCSGKGMTRREAWGSCLGEAVERYSGAHWAPDELLIASRGDLKGRSLDPRDLVLYADDQYETLPYTPYDDEAELAWVRGRSLVFDDEVWLPAVAVFMDYTVHGHAEYLFPITSNGLAAGPTAHSAVLSALTEVLERDAMLITWLNQLSGHPHDPVHHPDGEVRRMAGLYRQRGVELSLIELITDHPVSVFLGLTLMPDGGDGPSAAVGLGADLDPVAAARKAALEVGQVRPSIRRRARLSHERVKELAANPLEVKSMEDHALLYADHSTAKAFDFLFGPGRPWETRLRTDSAAALRTIVDHFRDADQDILYVNLTPADMASLGVHSARVVVPGFQPIWFGRDQRRLGGRRVFEFARRQGLRPESSAPDEMNPMPHPIA